MSTGVLCQRCNEYKDINATRIVIDGEKLVLTCLMCEWNFDNEEMARDMENQAVETHFVFMESADKIWKQILR
jgi:hypothetical protein